MGVVMSVGGPKTRDEAPFAGWLLFLLVSACISTQLRHDPVVIEDAVKGEHEMSDLGADEIVGAKLSRRIASANDLHAAPESIARRLWRVVRDPGVALRFFLFLMSGASMTITDLYLFLWLADCGGTPAVMGAALFCTCVCEVAIFYNSAKIKKALTLDWCLALVPFCYFVRQFYYWLLPSLGSPWAVLPVQFLHGITFGLYWSTANDFIQEISPYGLSASMTGLFSAVNSAGGFSGAVLGGMAYDAYDGGRLFLGVGLINLCLGAFFTALKLTSDRANAVAYVLLENESTEDAPSLALDISAAVL
jgi:predicted MFS family arabinose efflux permease